MKQNRNSPPIKSLEFRPFNAASAIKSLQLGPFGISAPTKALLLFYPVVSLQQDVSSINPTQIRLLRIAASVKALHVIPANKVSQNKILRGRRFN